MNGLIAKSPFRRIVDSLGNILQINVDGSTPTTAEGSGVIDTGNSTAVPLGAGGVFTGAAADVLEYGTIEVSVYSDVASATDGLQIQQSPDGINWDHSDPYTVPAATGKNYSINRVSRYFRIVYTNGSSAQSEFRLQIILNKIYIKPSSHRLSDKITSDDDAELSTTILKVIGGNPNEFQNVDVRHPVPADGDSVYLKDIDYANSDNGGFGGTVSDYFDGLKTVNVDASADNPKTIKIWFNRSLQTNAIGFGCDNLNKSFSNIKIKILGSGEEVRFTKDLSFDSTKRNSYLVKLPPLAFNGVIFEFHTSDEVGLSNVIIFKVSDVNARIAAVSELSDDIEDINSFRGALNVNQALVHKTGINEYFKRDAGAATTLSVAAAVGDTSITVASTTDLAIGDLLRISTPTTAERGHFKITDIVGSVLTLNRPIDTDLPVGANITEIEIAMSLTGTIASPLSFKIQPPPFERWQLTRLLIGMLSASPMDDGLFGSLVALPNGVTFRSMIDGVLGSFTVWSANKDLRIDMYNVSYTDKAPAGQYGLSGRWTLTASEFVVDLDGATNDYLEILIQDDLSGLDDFSVKAQGRLFGG